MYTIVTVVNLIVYTLMMQWDDIINNQLFKYYKINTNIVYYYKY